MSYCNRIKKKVVNPKPKIKIKKISSSITSIDSDNAVGFVGADLGINHAIINAKKTFTIVIDKFPNTEYALDAEFKIDLINDILAAKEMYVGRYYIDKKKWIPAINRFREVADKYETTIYVEEALYRLVEVHYLLGLKNEAEKYAKLLGYNYQSSTWYEKSYAIFDKMYELNKNENEIKSKKQNSLLKKFKSLFE